MSETSVPEGRLVVVATPLGNLGDLAPRALETLTSADVVYCEDTRHSRTLFAAHGVSPRQRLLALHEHNEAEVSLEVVQRVARGELVALVSDAGTPGISDPGARVVAAVVAGGGVVSTVPGPSAVVAALSISGLATDRFVMEGFLPRKAGERAQWYEAWARESRTVVAYESPQRLATTLTELAERFPARQAVVARELTKVHEEVVRGSLAELADVFATRAALGEVVLVVAGASAAPLDGAQVDDALRAALAGGSSVRDAAREVADALGVAHREAYRRALALRGGSEPS